MMFLYLLIAAALIFLGAEALSRYYCRKRFGIPFRNPARIYQAYYPGLEKIEKKSPSREDGFFNILMLGTSVTEGAWGEVEKYLAEQLALNGHKNVKIFNLSGSGLTNLDNFYQYDALEDFRFDLVLLYPSGMEAKADNIPPQFFRDDLGHFSDYSVRNYLFTKHGKAKLSLAYGWRAYYLQTKYKRNEEDYVPFRLPREKWLDYGGNMLSCGPFKNNVTRIIEKAMERGEKVIVMTHAFHTSENYSIENFRNKQLDYALHLIPYESFGKFENIVNTFEKYNEIIRNLGAEYQDIVVVDQEKLMSGAPGCFNDPFHFTVLGSVKFVDNLLPQVLSVLDSSPKLQALCQSHNPALKVQR